MVNQLLLVWLTAEIKQRARQGDHYCYTKQAKESRISANVLTRRKFTCCLISVEMSIFEQKGILELH